MRTNCGPISPSWPGIAPFGDRKPAGRSEALARRAFNGSHAQPWRCCSAGFGKIACYRARCKKYSAPQSKLEELRKAMKEQKKTETPPVVEAVPAAVEAAAKPEAVAAEATAPEIESEAKGKEKKGKAKGKGKKDKGKKGKAKKGKK